MRAAVCYGAGEPLRVEEISAAPPKQGEVRITVGACAICQSDLHYMSGAWPGRPFPAVCGHEVAGTVADCGHGVAEHREGDRVLVSLIRHCGQCRYCKAGASYLCEGSLPLDKEARFHNGKGEVVHQGLRTGGFAEQVVVHASQVVGLPDALPLEQASLLACGVLTGVGAVSNAAKLEAGRSAAVIGVGGVGVNCVQGAAIAGAEPIIAIDTEPAKFELARLCGATHALDARDENLVEAVTEITGGIGVDYVFVAAGNAQAMELGGELLAKLGCMVIASLPPAGVTPRIQPRFVVNKNQTIIGTKMGTANLARDVPRLIEMHREGRLKLAELIAARQPLDKINEAIAEAGKGAAARHVIVFD